MGNTWKGVNDKIFLEKELALLSLSGIPIN